MCVDAVVGVLVEALCVVCTDEFVVGDAVVIAAVVGASDDGVIVGIIVAVVVEQV